MDAELMSFRELIAEVLNPDREPLRSRLELLTNIDRPEFDVLRGAWPGAPLERRREVLERLVQLARERFDLCFDPVFRFCMDSDDEAERVAAIAGAGESEDTAFIRPLAKALQTDKSVAVRVAASTVLGNFALMAELGGMRRTYRDVIYDALLAAARNDGDDLLVRARALEAVSFFSGQEISRAIMRAYDSGIEELEVAAISAMGHNADPSWLSKIMDELDSEDEERRWATVRAAGEMGVEEAVPKLMRIAKADSIEGREAAIAALGEIGGEIARKFLESLLKSTDKRVKKAAEEALDELLSWEEPLAPG